MKTEPELLNERLDRLALVLDEIMPNCANLVRDALDLLKEQENCENCAIAIEDRRPIVRCKDCKHRPTDPENKGLGQSLVFPDDVCPCQIGDNWYSWMPKDDWFCADGRRRDE